MKLILKIRKKSVVGAIVAMAAFAFIFTGCQRDFEMDLPLAVNSNDVSLSKEAGSTHVLVYSDGEWTARFTKQVKWASINKKRGYGNNEIVFTYAANYGASRSVGVIFNKGNLADTVVFTQAGAITEPSIIFDNAALTLLKASGTVQSTYKTNMPYSIDDFQATVTYIDENGNKNEPIPVEITRQTEEGEDGDDNGEGDGEEEEGPVAIPVDPWISNVVLTSNDIHFDVLENTTGFPRMAELTLFIVDATGTTTSSVQTITQSINNPEFELGTDILEAEGYAASYLVEATVNNLLPYADVVDIDVVYDQPVEEGAEWLLTPRITAEGLAIDLTMNESDSERTATVAISFTDALGNSVSGTLKVKQAMYPVLAEFSEVRALPEGEITLQKYIEGFVVSDPESKNIISSPQTAQFMFDRGVNDRTIYVESIDGTYGFCMQFDTAEDNTLERFQRVRIALNGLTLDRVDDPVSYTITGLTATNILKTWAADEFKIPVKTKSITELTDNDIYTLVSIPNLEIMDKAGAYTNCTDGYSLKDDINPIGATAPRWDVAPLKMYDREGNTINMLTNAAVPWRRFSTGHISEWNVLVPQGSGTFRGILVADEVVAVRYGDVGRYQLRAMTESEIALDEEAPFMNTLVEWNWNNQSKTFETIPEIGNGSLNLYGATTATASDFNGAACSAPGITGTTAESKGLRSYAAINVKKKWWNFDTNEGNYFDVEFSTQGVNGNTMIFGITWGTGAMNNTSIFGPSHWKLLYSIDGGESFKEANTGDIVKLRYVVWWSTTPNDAAPGFTEHIRVLPDECFNKEKVILRLQVADTVTNIVPPTSAETWRTNLGSEKGTLTSSNTEAQQEVRIGTITVRYN